MQPGSIPLLNLKLTHPSSRPLLTSLSQYSPPSLYSTLERTKGRTAQGKLIQNYILLFESTARNCDSFAECTVEEIYTYSETLEAVITRKMHS